MTREEIEAGKSEKGGYTKAALSQWGVPWPPPKGWKEALLAGKTMKEAGLQNLEPSPILNTSAHELLQQVVLAVVEQGHGSDLNHLPEVLDYFGARMPSEQELAEAQNNLRRDF